MHPPDNRLQNPNRRRLLLLGWMKVLQKLGSRQLLPRLLFRFRRRNRQVRRVRHTRLVLCEGLQVIVEFTHTTPQSSNLSHDEWLANLFSSGLPSPELPADFPLATRRVLMSQFPTSSSSMLELSGWAIDLGQASLEMMFISSLCRVRRLRLTHECQNLVLTPFPLLRSGFRTYTFHASRLDAVVLFPTLSAILRTSPLRTSLTS